MKAGMLVDTYLPIMGGAEIHTLELSRALRARGVQVSVCTAMPAAESAGDEFPTLRLPALNGGGRRAFLRIPLALPQLWRFIRGVDVVHCHYSFLLAALGVFVGRLQGKPTVVTLHGLGTLDSSVDRSRLYHFYRWLSLRFARRIIATSEEMRGVALRFAPPQRVKLIPNGVDAEKFTPAPRPERDEIVILTMRRLAAKNGVQYLVEAAPQVVAELPQARFWVAGEGKLEAAIRRRVSELGLEAHFRFLGVTPHAQTPAMYRLADVVAFPSSAESISLACLEAMCCEKAIVASALAPYKELLGAGGERGLLVDLFGREESDYNAPPSLPAQRIQALAEAILRLAQDAPLRAQLGAEARRFAAASYDWSVIARQTVEQCYP
ncbi:MAG: glycosyltransferase family 4 protein [Chloroflexi bacterium]|nr:glycosyltransferase family 4 protein [Chloroflexota bacterium]